MWTSLKQSLHWRLIGDCLEGEIIQACKIVFGPEVKVDSRFVSYLQLSGLKKAFRSRAKELHPDLSADQHERVLKERAQAFHELREAFERLLIHVKQRRRSTPPTPQTPPAKAPDHRAEKPEPKKQGHYYSGPIPPVTLEFGLFLFYRGLVSSQELYDALRWQRAQRPPLGELACRWGWIDAATVHRVLNSRLVSGRFGEKCIGLGVLNSSQVRTLIHFQRIHQKRIGQYFVREQIMTNRQLERLLGELHFHNARLNLRSNG